MKAISQLPFQLEEIRILTSFSNPGIDLAEHVLILWTLKTPRRNHPVCVGGHSCLERGLNQDGIFVVF